MLSPGNVVERYEVERELGGGGMARVYKVRHVALGSVHALKVLDPELVGNAELRTRFLDEGRIQARLKHPNILGITDVVAAPGVAGLVMDYLEGESLDKYLARARQPPDADEVRDIFLQVLEGMGFAHAQGVIHRDLKPSNIFLEQVHGRRVVRILDFGIAKVAGAEGRPTTRTGARMGTPQYMSPEQIRGAGDVTVRSDIFSLGVTLYELATGHPCFQGESDFNIMEKIVRAGFVPPDVAHPGIERGLRAAILRAMDLEPERRFASCREFAAALEEEVEPAPAQVAAAQVVPVLQTPATPVQEPEPEPVQAPAPRVVEVRRAPAAIEKSAPVRERSLPAKKPAPPSSEEDDPPRRKAWRWVLLFALAGLVAMFGPGLIGMLLAGGAPVTRPSPVARNESLLIEVRPAHRTKLELMDPQGRRFTVTSPYVDRKPTPGVWHVVGKAPGYEDERWTVEVTPGKPASLRVSLSASVP
ncbi:serine/threonine-protein kinase [Archangium sp.]|uniref:serine/threonine-protein kinase n=1 Tax=Archangium sp. TaxID=1872627 RepID=UPI002D4C1C0A|nr:protein kinase [Archangium sp.]HYO51768.1 protein kinase [Archangium sp.]